MQAVRSGWLRVSETLVDQGLISKRDAERALRLGAFRRVGEANSVPEVSEAGETVRAPVYLCFYPASTGYRLVARAGDAPALGDVVELDRRRYEAARIAPSPLPDDRRRCVYLEPEPPPAPAPSTSPD